MNRAGLRLTDVATDLEVSPKTVERWITKGRLPYPKHRSNLAALVGETENYLWPDALSEERKSQVSAAEVVNLYPQRSDVPRDVWQRLFKSATEQIDILVYAGTFLAEEHGLAKHLARAAGSGAKVRMLLGDPNGDEVAARGAEEGIGEAMAARIRNALVFYDALVAEGLIEARLHNTTLYNSILRFDDEMLVNAHIYGLVGAQAPLLHLRQLGAGDLFQSYVDSFDKVWATAKIHAPAMVS